MSFSLNIKRLNKTKEISMKRLVISLTVMGVLLAGCSDNKKEGTANVAQNAPVVAQEEKVVVIDKAKEEIKTAAAQVEQKSVVAVEEVKKESTEAVIEQKVEEATKMVEEVIVPVNQRGIDLYVKCAACHGQNGEKKALGTSQVIKGWSVEQSVSALKGYKNKTYGGSMKTVMTTQVATLSNEDIDALAQLIATF
jgi:cytochrome c553